MISATFKWRNDDSTLDLNNHTRQMFQRGILEGGLIVPVTPSGTREIDLQPLKYVSNEGMIVTYDTAERHSLTPNQTSIVTLYSKYLIGADPVIETRIYELSYWNGLLDKEDHVIAGIVTTTTAPEVQPIDILYSLREAQDRFARNPLRGKVTSIGALPGGDLNQIGDMYVITPAVDTVPYIYVWDGNSWENLTDTVLIADELNKHRINFYTDEKHLTDDEFAAMAATVPTATASNPFVTEGHSQLPTQDEKDALAGSDGAPSAANKYITQEFGVVDPVAVGFIGPVSPIPVTGPIFVGTDPASLTSKFTLLDNTSPTPLERGYLNPGSESVTITGVYKDSGLTTPLVLPDPLVDAEGFFPNTLYLTTDNPISLGFRVLYGTRSDLKTVERDYTFGPNPTSVNVLPSNLMGEISRIKGRDWDDPNPDRESNSSLRIDLDYTKAYLGTGLETNIVAALDDYERLSKSDVGQYFQEVNIGVDNQYTFDNTGLVSFAYDRTTGTVTYGSPVSLVSVLDGNVFLDSAGNQYLIATVGANQVVIRSVLNGLIPFDIDVTAPSQSSHGACIVNANPRNILLSEMKCGHQQEFYSIPKIEVYPEEYYKPSTVALSSGYVGWGFRRNNNRFEPRVVLFGGWENAVNDKREELVRNGSSNGLIQITGYFSAVSLVMRRFSNSPSLNVYTNGEPPALVDPTVVGRVSDAISNTYGYKRQTVEIATGLNMDAPNTITVAFDASSSDPMELYGVIVDRVNHDEPYMESGRAFSDATLVRRDVPGVITGLQGLEPYDRGARTQVIVRDILDIPYSPFGYLPLDDLDKNSLPAGSVSGAVLTITAGFSKVEQYYKTGDLLELINAADTGIEINKIASINVPGTQIILDSASSLSGVVKIMHRGSTELTDPIAERNEKQLARYSLVNDFIQHTDTDFEGIDTKDRYVLHVDGTTLITGQSIGITNSGISGVEAAALLDGVSSSITISGVFTRLDIITANNASIAATYSVDGSPSYSLVNGGGARRHTVLYNSRYQHHNITINGNGLCLSDIILFGPNYFSFSDNPNIVADMSYIARYVSREISGVPQTNTVGSYFLDAPHFATFINGLGANPDWTEAASLNFTKSPTGKYIYTENESAYAEIWFSGDGFELPVICGPDHGYVEIEVDGTSIDAFPSGKIPSTVVMPFDTYNATYTTKNLGVYGIGWGHHRVIIRVPNPRQKNPTSTGYLVALTGLHVINSDGFLAWTYNQQGVYTSAADVRDFIPVVVPPSVPTIAGDISYIRSDEVATTPGTQSMAIVFNAPLADNNYVVNISFRSDAAIPIYQPIVISDKTSTGFTAKWNAPIPANYYLQYIVFNKV